MTKKYLTGNPAHTDFLDLLQTKSVGFKLHFWKYDQSSEVSPEIAAAANRIQFAVRDCVSRIARLASDVTKTVPMQHEAARQVYDRLQQHVAKDIAFIRTKANADAEAARDRAFAVIAADPDKAAVHAEVRQIFREKAASGDPAWPAEALRLMKTDPTIAAAVGAASALNSGLSEDRHKALVFAALEAHAPDDVAAMNRAVDVGKEADKLEQGMSKLKAAAYDTAQSNKARDTFVDPAAPFAAPPEAAE